MSDAHFSTLVNFLKFWNYVVILEDWKGSPSPQKIKQDRSFKKSYIIDTSGIMNILEMKMYVQSACSDRAN